MTSIIINRLNNIDQIREQRLKELKETGENLESTRTFLKFKAEFKIDKDEEKWNKYLEERKEYILCRRKLQDALISSIAKQLEKYNGDLELGISDLKKELEKLENTVTILQTIERVIGIISRIVLLAR
ncbi:hypothetical protein NIES25_07230 [Nostoc linckia NIES-25]|nr:hypothetical protein NIES25_07230 [Nostoc linckia NIES-25]